MRIVDRKTLMTMPAGTIYQPYEPCIGGDLCVLGPSLEYDFTYATLTAPGSVKATDTGEWTEKLAQAEVGQSIQTEFDIYGREGLFNDAAQYLVWEATDLKGLIEVLRRGLEVSEA